MSELDPPVRYVTIHGYERAYRLLGAGPPLLLVHGIGDSSEGWAPVMAPLAEHFTVIAPDLLGHGRSAKPRADYSVAAYANGMRDLLDVLDFDSATVVGHSLGGGVAAQMAYQYPERCERLVLVSTGGVSREVTPVLRLATVPLAELALGPLQLPLPRLAGRLGLQLLRLLGTDIGRDAEAVQRVVDGMPDGPSRGAFSRTLRSVVDWRGQIVTMRDRAYLSADVPVMLIWGEHDGVIPVAHAELASESLPTASLEIYSEAGHFPHHSDPDRFVADVRGFVDATTSAVHDADVRRTRLRAGSTGAMGTHGAPAAEDPPESQTLVG